LSHRYIIKLMFKWRYSSTIIP